MAKSMAEIAALLKNTKFKRSLMGLDEADVWSKLTRLQAEYAAVVAAEHEQCQALLNERDAFISKQNESIRKLQAQLQAGRADNRPADKKEPDNG